MTKIASSENQTKTTTAENEPSTVCEPEYELTNPETGLSAEEVNARIAAGEVNTNADVRTRSVGRIFRDNICTLFNLVNVLLGAAIFWTGSYRNLLFLGVVVCNIAIGIFQEIRSKRTIDKLSVMTATKAHVVRDGKISDIQLSQLVRGDVIELGRGDQVPSDCVVLTGKASANEALLTGESDLVPKGVGSKLFSGSFVNQGSCRACVTSLGAENYAAQISNEAKSYKRVKSEIMDSLNKLIRFVTILIVPLGGLLFCKETFLLVGSPQAAILHTSAALVGMIPQGFILLTSAVLAVSVVRLAQHKVLVQELRCVETLARVDVICLDKTGTITTGEMDVDEMVPFKGVTYTEALHVLKALANEAPDENATIHAIKEYVAGMKDAPSLPEALKGAVRIIPFSSERKYSGVCFGSEAGNYAIGAAEFVLKDSPLLSQAQEVIERLAGVRRVLVLAQVEAFAEDDAIEGEVKPLGYIFIRDRVRTTARKTLEYFAEQGVRVNIISGDSVETVSHIAASVGVPGADKCIDMTTVHSQADLELAAEECRVFGRVSPDQKKELVKALQKQGHTVAMTGDGVNDVLALHQSDCSVAMGSGASAARSVAQLVLLNDDFASMPKVVAEGRRSINNLQRSGALFLVKTLFSAVMALLFIFIVAYNYPFVTIQLTLISSLTIGLPSFVLALEPNHDRIKGRFLRNIVFRAIPGAATVVLVVLISVVYGFMVQLTQEQFSTLCVILTCVMGVNLVIRLSIPFNPIRITLLVAILAGLFLGIFVFGDIFMLVPFSFEMTTATIVLAAIVTIVFNLLFTFVVRHEDELHRLR